MSDRLTLKILTPQGVAYDADVDAFVVPTEQGPLMIEPNYTNLIAALSPSGVLRVSKGKQNQYFAIFGGVLRVNRLSGCEIYTEEINDGYEIDMARAIAARDRNLDLIEKKEPDTDIALARFKLAKALTRIETKTLSEGSH
ncbi:MAG: F0F1 ATP synthase subunit epsilon [Bacilli bacterium]|nr:F0F1 ATP synthase subunit epsilon [Bacilli bacterium]